MSSMRRVAVECPACNKKYDIEIWETLNATLDRGLKEKLFSGKFFSEVCPNCGEENNVNYPLLYHDMKQNVMIKLVLDKRQAEWKPKSILGSFPWFETALDGYRFRVVTSPNALREKAMIFDRALDDRIVEIIKCFYWAEFNKENPNVDLFDIFLFNNGSSYILEFMTDDNKSYTVNFDMEMYELINKEALTAIDYESEGCCLIGQEWARSIIPPTLEEQKKFLLSLCLTEWLDMWEKFQHMDCDEVKSLAIQNNNEALVELLIRERCGKLTLTDRQTFSIIEDLVIQAVDDIKHDPEKAYERYDWQTFELWKDNKRRVLSYLSVDDIQFDPEKTLERFLSQAKRQQTQLKQWAKQGLCEVCGSKKGSWNQDKAP